jgi:hypothetical protein
MKSLAREVCPFIQALPWCFRPKGFLVGENGAFCGFSEQTRFAFVQRGFD